MGKFFVRITVIMVAFYFMTTYVIAQWYAVNVFTNWYKILLELCIVIYSFSEGKYHCKFLKSTALAILICDLISELDYVYDFMSVDEHNLILIAILATGMTISFIKAISHFFRVILIKNRLWQNIKCLTRRLKAKLPN